MIKNKARGAPFRGAAASMLSGDSKAKPEQQARTPPIRRKRSLGKSSVFRGVVPNIVGNGKNRLRRSVQVDGAMRERAKKTGSTLSEFENMVQKTGQPTKDRLNPQESSTGVAGTERRRRIRTTKELKPEPAAANGSMSGLERLVQAPADGTRASVPNLPGTSTRSTTSAAPTSIQTPAEKTTSVTPSSANTETEFDDTAEIKKGDTVLYRERDGKMTEVVVTSVDYALIPPSFLIRINGGERETERHRLFVRKQAEVGTAELEELLHQMKSHPFIPNPAAAAPAPRKQKLEVMVLGGRHLPPSGDSAGSLDGEQAQLQQLVACKPLFIRLTYLGKQVRTTMRWDDLHPDWNERFPFALQGEEDGEEDEDLEVCCMSHAEDGTETAVGVCAVSGAEMQQAPLEGEGEAKQLVLVLYDGRGRKLVGADGRTTVVSIALKKRVVPQGARSSL